MDFSAPWMMPHSCAIWGPKIVFVFQLLGAAGSSLGLPLYSIRGVEREIKDDNDNDDDNNIRDSSERCHRWRALARTKDSRFVSTGSESE